MYTLSSVHEHTNVPFDLHKNISFITVDSPDNDPLMKRPIINDLSLTEFTAPSDWELLTLKIITRGSLDVTIIVTI